MQRKKLVKIGDKYGRLTVINEAEPAYKYNKKAKKPDAKSIIYRWLCRCSCGKEKIINQGSLRKPYGATISCGCAIKGKTSAVWTGCGEMPGRFWRNIIASAKKRNLEFSITKEQAWQQFIKQKKKCALTGIPLKFDSKSKIRDGNASLDRINSNKGYTIDNISWVHKKVNEMKLNLSKERFIELCHLVAAYCSTKIDNN